MENRTTGTYLAFCCDHWELLPRQSIFPVHYLYSGWPEQTNKEINKLKTNLNTVGNFKALAKRNRKWRQVENLGLLATPFGQVLRALALTYAHFCRTQVDASFSPFGHPTQVNAS